MDNPEVAEEENRPPSEGLDGAATPSQPNTPLPEQVETTEVHEGETQEQTDEVVEESGETQEEQPTGDESNVQVEERVDGEMQETVETVESGEHENTDEHADVSLNETGLNESTANEEDSRDHVDETSGSSGTVSPTSRHREIQRKKARPPRRKLDDDMIAEEDVQEDGFKSPHQMPLEGISQNLDDSGRYHGHDPELIKPTTPDRMKGLEEDEEVVEEPELKMTREEIIARYHNVLEERERNQNLNNQLHHKLADYFRKRKNEDAQAQQIFDKSSQDQEQRYNKYLSNIEELHKELEKQHDIFDYQKFDLKSKCENKQQIVQEERGKFLKLKREIALKSVSGHTGKQVTNKDIEPYFLKESQKEQEVIQVRLENIKLKNQLKKRENQLKEKEELGEGLHLIDFEQLKIENQTYNEKIEERNEELMKLKKKINNTVQILTHVKEKLKFVNAENEKEKESLAYFDDEVKRKRDVLNRIKQSRDSLRLDNNRLKQNSGLLGNTTLLRDFEESVDENESLRSQIEQLKRKHAELLLNSKGLKKKISQVKATEK